MSQYIAGSVSVSNGSAAIVGVGTLWSGGVAAGNLFSIAGSNVPYIVGSVTDNTHLTLSSNYAGDTASAQPYSITTSFTPNNSLPYPEDHDIDTATIIKRAMLLIDTLFAALSGSASQLFKALNFLAGYTTTVTAAGTTVLTSASTQQQFFTGTTTQTVTMPVTSTLILGQTYLIANNSTGAVTVNSSGGNLIATVPALTNGLFTCILTSGTTAASWAADISALLAGSASQTFAVAAAVATVDAVRVSQLAANAGSLPYYETYTSAGSATTGAIAIGCVFNIVRIGNLVTLALHPFTSGGTVTNVPDIQLGDLIPSAFRPPTDEQWAAGAEIIVGGVIASSGVLRVKTDGTIILYRDGTTTLGWGTVSNTGLQYGFSMSWVI